MKFSRFLIFFQMACIVTVSFAQKEKADKYFDKGLYAKAIPLYEKAAKQGGKTKKETLSKLGDCYRILNEFKNAEATYKKALSAKGTNNPDLYYYYGYVLKANNKYDEALNQFFAYLDEKPNDTKAKNALRSCQQIKFWKSKAIEYEIKNVEGINTARSEFAPAINNSQLVYVAEKQSDFFEYSVDESNGQPFMNIYSSKVDVDQASKIKPFSSKINTNYHDGPVSFSADGKTVLFTRVDYKADSKNKNFVNRAKIYMATSEGKKWKDVKAFEHNSDAYSVAHPSISNDGNLIVFTSDMPGGQGGKDLWYCKKKGDGWDKPVNMGYDINTSGDEMFPYLRKDGVLFFASNGLAGFGGLDIFSAKEKDGKWIVSRNESMNLNSSVDDFGICFLNDSTGYFTSNREGGKGKDDIYWFKYKNKYITVSGNVLLTENVNDPAKNVKVSLLTADGKKLDSTKTDQNGFFEFKNLDVDKKYIAAVESDDPQFVGKARYFLANNGNINRVTNKVNGVKFAFVNLPADANSLPMLYGNDDLTLAGNLLYGENPSKPIKNTKISITNKFGDVLETTTTNEFGAFAFRNLPPDQNYMISLEETDIDLPAGTKVILTNKSGKEIKSFLTGNGKFKFNVLSTEKVTLSDLDVEDADLMMELYGYIYDQDKKPLSNAKINIRDANDEIKQIVTTDDKGKFIFKTLKANQEYMFEVDGSDPRLATLKKLLIADQKGRVYKELLKSADGRFQFKVLSVDKVALGEFTVDDPWLQVLEMKNKAKKDSVSTAITIVENIYYAFGDYKFDQAGQMVLDKVVSIMLSNKKLNVELSSHTDSRSSDAFNLALSQKRAKAAVDYMISKGVEKSRLKAVGYGETKLLNKCSNNVECTDEEHAKNRRTEFKILESPKI